MTAAVPDWTISKRSREIWKKFSDWYGADVIAKHFGAFPSREWCESIDSIPTRKAFTNVLSDVRHKHVTFPPRFPEFDQIVSRYTQSAQVNTGPSVQEQLREFVLRTKPLTREQIRLSWHDLYAGNHRAGSTVIGVIVPADPEHNAPGYRVTVEDMQMAQAERQSVG